MATATTKTRTQATDTGVVPYRLTVDQFFKMIGAGVFPDQARVELLEGELVERMVKNEPHNWAVETLAARFRELVAPLGFVREEKSLRIGRWSRPEPDIVVVRGQHGDYSPQAGPQAQDVLLVVEVADSTYTKDHGRMWRLYAAAGMPVYWIVNLPQRRIEVYTRPTGRGRTARYQESMTFDESTETPVVLDGREIGRVRVRELLV